MDSAGGATSSMMWRLLIYVASFYLTGVGIFVAAPSSSLMSSPVMLAIAVAPVAMLAIADSAKRSGVLVASFAREAKWQAAGLRTLISLTLIVCYVILLVQPRMAAEASFVRGHLDDQVFVCQPGAWFIERAGPDPVRRRAFDPHAPDPRCVELADGRGVRIVSGQPANGQAEPFGEGPLRIYPRGQDLIEFSVHGRITKWLLPPATLEVTCTPDQRDLIRDAGFHVSSGSAFNVTSLKSHRIDESSNDRPLLGLRLHTVNGSRPSLSRKPSLIFFDRPPSRATETMWALSEDESAWPYLLTEFSERGLPRLMMGDASCEPSDMFGVEGHSLSPRLMLEEVARTWRSCASGSATESVSHDNRSWFRVSPWKWVFMSDVARNPVDATSCPMAMASLLGAACAILKLRRR